MPLFSCILKNKRYNMNQHNKKGHIKMQNVDEFIESLLNDKGITDIDPEIKEDLKADMKKRLLDQIDRAAIQALPEDKAVELAKLVEQPDFTNEKMTEFMQKSGVNLTEVVADTMLKFRGFYLGTEE